MAHLEADLLEALLRMLRSDDESGVVHGIETARALADPALLAELTAGLSVSASGRPCATLAWKQRVGVPLAHRETAILRLLLLHPEQPLQHITHLDLAHMDTLSDLECLRECPQLTSLSVNGCKSLTSLDVLTVLPNLRTLSACECPSVASVPELAEDHPLEVLLLSHCVLRELPEQMRVPHLRVLSLYRLRRLRDLGCLRQARQLRRLVLKGCGHTLDLRDLTHCTQLESLELVGDAVQLERLPASLQELLVVGGEFFDLRWLAPCSGLQTLFIDGVERLNGTAQLAELPALTEVKLRPERAYGEAPSESVVVLNELHQLAGLDPEVGASDPEEAAGLRAAALVYSVVRQWVGASTEGPLTDLDDLPAAQAQLERALTLAGSPLWLNLVCSDVFVVDGRLRLMGNGRLLRWSEGAHARLNDLLVFLLCRSPRLALADQQVLDLTALDEPLRDAASLAVLKRVQRLRLPESWQSAAPLPWLPQLRELQWVPSKGGRRQAIPRLRGEALARWLQPPPRGGESPPEPSARRSRASRLPAARGCD